MPNYVPGTGPFESKLMIIGDFPDKASSDSGTPFSGPPGYMLEEFLRNNGVSKSECYLTYVVKYQAPFNDVKKFHLINVEIPKSIEDLWEKEIKVYKPNCILAVGDLALQACINLVGVQKYRGSILTAVDNKTKVVPTIPPSSLFSRWDNPSETSGESKGALNYVWRVIIQHDVARAVEESNTSTISLPVRDLNIARNSLDLFRFFRRYESFDKASCDIESINCIPVCVGFSFNRNHAISIPLIKRVNNIDFTGMSYRELSDCWRMIDVELRRLKIVGHNFKYDDFKLSLAGFNIPNVYSDTLIKTRVIFPELPLKNLGVVGSIWTREPYWKDEGKEFKLGKMKIDNLFLYNAKDCAVEIEVDEEQETDLIDLQNKYHVPLVDYYYNYMMRKHKLYLNLESHGFLVDKERKEELSIRYSLMRKSVHERITSKLGYELNVKSTPQKFDLLYNKFKFPGRKKTPTSEEAIVALIGNHCKKPDDAFKKSVLEDILEETRIRTQESNYINFTPDYDGRCRTSYNISATETCRSSTSILDKPVRPKKMGLSFHTISKHGRLAKDIRSMFPVDKGKVFLQADSSQCQARIVAVLAEDWELLKAFDTVDVHRRTAGLIFGLTPDLNLSEGYVPIVDDIGKDDPMRFTGKKTRHAGNFDMRKRTFALQFNTDAQKFEIDMEISEWKAGQMLDRFHEASPKLRNIFYKQIQEAISETRCLIDPFGGIRIFNGRMDDNLFKEGYANIPQRTEAHLIQNAALKINDEIKDPKEACLISENHDSLLMLAPASNWEPYAQLMKKHMQTPIDFSKYCSLKRDYILTIPSDIEMSDTNYGEMRKVKLS